ncbi:hypothetical protein K3G63_06575 [Hymenobacter sp. HSC-4F20]|uniref:hypothetical protein n=1 Tax=Hymenobacter sp. HSC-4F20 TaxID=2864135 RepID=UPI001C731950|nr:hypothetical protein [Hymenobacter sp. HSC-4F20]MBX0290095.1 hypothetical protein [Hymenobacter sp. HSC-4F20]
MNEREERLLRYHEYLIEEEKQELQENAAFISAFKEECIRKGITLGDEHFSYVKKTGVVATYPNLITHLCPDLSRDKDGLFDFSELTTAYKRQPFASGYLISDTFMLMAHPYFRRGLHELNSYAPRFIDKFWHLSNPDLKLLIAVDLNRVRVDVNDRMTLEYDTWYGPKFSRDICTIPDEIVKLRLPPEMDELDAQLLANSTYSLDIKWDTEQSSEGVKRIFYAEEFKSIDETITINGEVYFPAKYVHSEFNVDMNCFTHFDGAMHLYTFDEYCKRIDSDINYNKKNSFKIKSNSIKLFRIDGKIKIETWIDLVSHFFTGNPLAYEYFEGRYPDYLSDFLKAKYGR